MMTAIKNKLTESIEDYLECIYEISREGPARVRDIASKQDVSMASVSGALKKLRARGLVKSRKYEYVELTPEGDAIARQVQGNHAALFDFLHRTLRLDEALAQNDACRIEHALSPETIERLMEFQAYFENCDPATKGWKSKLKKKTTTK